MEFYLLSCGVLGIGTLVWPFLAVRHSTATGWFAAMAPLVLFFWLATQIPHISSGNFPSWAASWIPELGVSLDFRLDGLGVLMSMLISGIGALILFYGGTYFSGSSQAAPFFAFVQLFMLSMLGLVAADNLLLFFIFWELTSLASYFLIGLAHTDVDARKSALQALLVTGAGGLALLAGILLLGSVGGTLSLDELQNRGELVRASSYYPVIFALIALGAFTKSAQMPFHFWLPDAMAAPTPVSAYLHSATMVKAGVVLLAKMSPVLGGTVIWHDSLMLAGGLTMFLGAVFALAQTDIKRLLAYSTMSALGTLVLLLGIGTELAIQAAMVFLVVHALYKASLFMIAGIVDKATGTRNITMLRGLGKHLPLVAFAAALSAFSMSGVPPFIGFIGKELLYEAQMRSGNYALFVTILGFAANAINVTVALKVGISPFLHSREVQEISPKARQMSLWIGSMLLALSGAWLGLYPATLSDGLISAAVRDVVQKPVEVHLKLWHGFNLLLGLSVVTVVFGLTLYLIRDRVRAYIVLVLSKIPIRASIAFDTGLASAVRIAHVVTRFFQHGNLRLYLVGLLLSVTSLLIAALASTGGIGLPQNSPVHIVPVAISFLTVAAGAVAIRSQSTVMAVLAMGGVGYGVALLFAVFGAPDLALTQVLVETLTLVLFALVIRQLPPLDSSPVSSPRRHLADWGIAATAGVTLTLALLAVRAAPLPMMERISADIAARSLPEAHGRNVVNVILVDFRALDTMGEICVLSIAALGVAGLLLGPHRRSVQAEQVIATPLFRTAVTCLTPLLIFMSIILLFRGHNEPGGGFAGGLVAGAGLILKRLAAPSRSSHESRKPVLWITAGLTTALVSTLPSLIFKESFMEGFWIGSIWLPIVGKTKLGTPFLFDVGVYWVVVGVCLLILSRLLRSETPQLQLDKKGAH